MAEDEQEEEQLEVTETDIFQQQKKTIDTLVQVLAGQGVAQPQPPPQVVYAAAAEPAKKAPNYLIYLAVGVLAILLFKK